MLVYLSVMVLCSILLYAMRNENKKARPLVMVFGIIWLMIALQDGWGGDHENYVMFFDFFKGMSFSDLLVDETHGSIGYKIIISIMPTEHFAMAFGMAIWSFAFAFLFYHFIPQKWWFLAILFVFLDRSIMMGAIASFLRMAVAQSLLVFAFYYKIKGKKWWISILLLLLGSLFHKSVLFMAPLLFIRPKRNKLSYSEMLVIFVLLAIFMMLFPSSWIGLVETIITSFDTFSSYEFYLDKQGGIELKGISLIVLFYWVYLLARQLNRPDMKESDYLILKLALVRIAFDLLPAAGMSTRFFYYIDVYFIGGMMVVFSRLLKNDVHVWTLAATLFLMFWYFGFLPYASTDFFKEHWSTYNLIF